MTLAALPSAVAPISFLVPGDLSTPTGGYRYDRRLIESLVAAGRPVEPLQLDGAWPWPEADTLARVARALAALPEGRCIVADGLAFGALDTVVADTAQRLRWVALVHHPLHLETGLSPQQSARLREGERRALRCARQVVVTSAHTVVDVQALGVAGSRIAVVEPGTDALPLRRAPTAEPGEAAPLQWLCVASVTPRKAHAVLLQALSGLRAWPWQLHCVGSLQLDAAHAAAMQALCVRLGLADRVVWHGEVTPAALQARYAAADVLVLASLHEGYGMAVAEALAAGLPVVASDAGALAQTLPPQAGLRVPAGNVAALQSALQRLLVDPPLRARLAAGAREAATRLPDWPTQAARFAAVLDACP